MSKKFTHATEEAPETTLGAKSKRGAPKGTRFGGRAKGTPNKITKELKDMILGALNDAGGQEYLATQAVLNPGPFMALVGKVLPTTIKGTGADGALVIQVSTGVPAE